MNSAQHKQTKENDADATEVHVSIGMDERNLPTVELRDNGPGMTRDDVHCYWMRTGTISRDHLY